MAYSSAPGYPGPQDINAAIAAYSGNAPGLNAGTVATLAPLINNYKVIPLVRTFGGFGTTIPLNQTFYLPCPANGAIVGYQMSSPDSGGSATVKLWKIANGTALPTVANVINTSGLTLNTATQTLLNSTTVTDFTTTAVTAYDQFAFTITAISVLTVMDFTLYVSRT